MLDRLGLPQEAVQLPELGLLPWVERVVVALGTLQLHAHEQPRGLGCRQHHFVPGGHLCQQEVDGPILVRAALGRDQVVDDFVPGAVLGERLAEEFLDAAPADQARRLPADRQVGPEGREVPHVGRIVQHLVDEGGPLVGAFILAEVVDFLPERDVAEEIERDPAEPFFVVGNGRLDDLVFLPGLANLVIDEGDNRIDGPVSLVAAEHSVGPAARAHATCRPTWRFCRPGSCPPSSCLLLCRRACPRPVGRRPFCRRRLRPSPGRAPIRRPKTPAAWAARARKRRSRRSAAIAPTEAYEWA